MASYFSAIVLKEEMSAVRIHTRIYTGVCMYISACVVDVYIFYWGVYIYIHMYWGVYIYIHMYWGVYISLYTYWGVYLYVY